MAQDILLHGFAFAGYRSFGGPQVQRVGPMSKVHLVAGPNNAGKSNVLTIAQRVLPAIGSGRADFAEGDIPLGHDPRESPLRVDVALPLTDDERADLVPPHSLLRGPLDQLLADDEGQYWFRYEIVRQPDGSRSGFVPARDLAQELVDSLSRLRSSAVLGQIASEMTNSSSSSDPLTNATSILNRVALGAHLKDRMPPVATVSAFRRIAPGTGKAEADGYDGAGLIGRLLELQSPSSFDAAEQERRFAAINRFVATLFEDPEARIQAANDGSTIFLYQGGRRLPLENHGTGVHEVVIMAAAATVLSGHLVCIEEPEIHLHPTLQRKLLDYLHRETDNQYLIATHSAHLLDTARASISAISLAGGNSRIEPAITPRQVADLSAELGLRASDLVQSNAVIWVEGPSDRIYLRHWLGLIDDGLVEGQHFSLMFYGGRLLSELSPQDPGVDEFVSLPRINRNFSIVIDSDKRSVTESLNATKIRVRDAFAEEDVRGVVWITAGYTIENYVPPGLLEVAAAGVHPQGIYTPPASQYESPLASERFSGRDSPADKPAIARAVVASWTKDIEWPLDLRERVQELAAAIRTANDLPAPVYGVKSYG